jgi:hypothetical protein
MSRTINVEKHLERFNEIADDKWAEYIRARSMCKEFEQNFPYLIDAVLAPDQEIAPGVVEAYRRWEKIKDSLSQELINIIPLVVSAKVKNLEADIKAGNLVSVEKTMGLFTEIGLVIAEVVAERDKPKLLLMLKKTRDAFYLANPGSFRLPSVIEAELPPEN